MEIFKDIKEYEGLYQVSNLGRVKSIGYGKEKFLKPANDGSGYQVVNLCKDGKPKMFLVHRLVASAFLPKPVDTNKTQVNHKDENKTNNVVVLNEDGSVDIETSNLEWCTLKYNINYGTHNERQAKAMTNGKLSKRVLQFTKSGEFVREWASTMEVHRVLGINQGNISKCCLGKRHISGGFVWAYA